MAWTAQQMAEKRAKLQKTSTGAGSSPSQSAQSAASSPKVGAKSGSGTAAASGGETWTADKMAAKRAALQSSKTVQSTVSANQLEQAYENYRMGNNLGFAQEQGGSLVDSNLTLSAASGGSSPKGGAKSGLYANAAQALKNSYTGYSQPDAFDKANQWYDQTRNQELVKKMTETKETGGYTSYAQQGTSMGGSADPFRTGNLAKKYSTADLEKMGYSADEIAQARNYLDTMESIPEWKQATRRTANTIGGIADTVAAAPLLGAEYLGQAAKNIRQSSVNRKALAEEVAANPREKNLYDRMMETDMDYQPKYSTGDLLQQGFTRQEIEEMRSRIAGTEASESIDPEKSVGYQLYNRGQQLTGAAQSGQTDAQKAVQGVVTSAAENLAVAAVNPAAVLPVLSAQGAAEAMGKSAEQSDSAGKALAGGALKFGAGWAINSVGAADLAKTMGFDYAKDTLAGNIADWVRGLAGDSAFAKQYPAIANAISGGMDNAVQAFVETYADQAIDAALGDSEAAKTLFSKDTLLTALESGLSGGASGALGGAVGTGLARMRGYDAATTTAASGGLREELLGQRPAGREQSETTAGSRNPVAPSRETAADGNETSQSAQSADGAGGSPSQSKPDGFASSPEGGANASAGEAEAETMNHGAAFEAAQQALKNPDAAESAAFVEPEAVIAANEAANAEAGVNGQAVENAGENVENPLRETYGLRGEESREAQQGTTARTLKIWGVSETAAQEIGQKLPEGTNAERYAAAASTLYRLGQMEDVKTFDQALELAGTGSGMAANVNYVLGNATGRNALEIAYTYGRGEAESRWEQSQLGGSLTNESLTGRGETLYEGTMRSASEAASRVIELNAAATGTTAVLKNVLQNETGTTDSRVRAYVDTETGKIFFGDSASDVFGTVLHEDWHWYNALDSEGAKQVMDHALNYLARVNGFETIDEMIRNKMTDYAGQGLTYEEAAEELVGDAWRGIFSNEEDFKRWVQFQRGQAEKNSGKAGTLHKVMNRVKEMLDGIVSRAKEILTLDPENAAARKAQRLAEKERRILQEEYFAHAEKAMNNLRAAKENAAALKHESAAEGRRVRFQLHEGKNSLADQMNGQLERLEEMEPVAKISGSEVTFGKTARENIDNIDRYFDSIGNYAERDGFGTVELTRYGAVKTVRHGNSAAKQIAVAAIPAVIQNGRQIGYESNWQGRGYDTYVFAAPVEIDETKIYEGVIVNSYVRENGRKAFYVHEVCWTDGSYVKFDDSGKLTKKEDIPTHLPMDVRSSLAETQEISSIQSISQNGADGKKNAAPVKKNIRFQLGAPVEVDSQKDLVAVHNLTEENLKEALELGGMPSPSIAVVKAKEGHTKYGPISLVFGPDAIDPMANSANRIYGSDAWTPTRPGVEYKVDADKAWKLNSELAQLARQTAEGAFARNNLLTGRMDMEASDKSPKQLAEQLARDDSVKAAYLAEKGETVQKVMKQESRYTESQAKRYEKIMDVLGGKEQLIRIVETDEKNGNHDETNAVLEKVRQAEKEWAMEELGWSEEKASTKADKLISPMIRARLMNAYEYAASEKAEAKLVQDMDAMRQELQQKAPDAEVEQWLLPKMEQVLGEKGIYNGKDLYTKTGNRRSFAQLHNAYTLENLVQAMNSQQEARGQGVFGTSASALMSTATAEYRNLDEVRADKGRLQQMPEEEYKAMLEKADAQVDAVIDRLRSETTAHADNSFEEREILGTVLMQAAQGKRTAAAIGKAFAREGYTIGKDTAQMILKLYRDVAKIPTGYFEAKPQRAVGFEEVEAAILPDNTSSTLIDSLKEKGVKVELYPAGDDAQRTKLLNKLQNVRFQKAEQADRESRKNVQRQASRTIADNSVMLETLGQMMGIARGVRISQDSIDGLALRWTKTTGSKTDRTKLAGETRALVEYLKADGADMSKAQSLAETLAGEVLDGATYRNTELWDEYPEYHELSYTVNRDGRAKAELVKRYGTWSEAVAEARRHGVKLRQEEGYWDGNPVEQYESIVNDTRAMGDVKDGAAALFRNAAKQAGVDGAASMESTEWLDVLMNVRDAIKPRTMSRFADAAEYEDAKVELAGRMIGDILNTDEMNDAQAIFDSFQKWQRNAVAAAVGEENADQALKDLRKVQKDQTRELNRRLYENRKTGSQNESVRKLTEQQKRNARAEKLLDENLEALGVDLSITNSGDMAEKLDVLKEAYEREWKAEKKRLREERQEMIDNIRLENRQLKQENMSLSYQVAGEQKRADAAEWQLIHQQNELMEWEEENQRKAQAWQEKQAQRNAIAVEVARQQRDEDIAIAKKLAEKRVEKAREGRKKDELKRAIRNNAAQLNQMVLRPAKDKYVQPRLIRQALDVARLADMTLLNQNAVNRLDALENSIRAEYGDTNHPVVTEMSNDWEQSGIANLISALKSDLTASREAKLDRLRQQLYEAEALEDSEKARALQDRLKARIKDVESKPYLPMTADQLRMLKAITSSTLHVIRTANKTLSLQQAEEVDKIAGTAAEEVNRSKGNDGKFRKALTRYNLDMLGGVRVFRMLGGYTKNGQMEKLGTMLNDGQRRQTEILVKGTHLFDDVTGKTNLKQMEKFAGKGAELVDIGLKDSHDNAVPLNHAQLCSLYMHLQNADSREHLLNGGFTVPDAAEYNRGNIEAAYQKGQTVRIGMLTDSKGNPVADTILNTIQKALTDYDRAWISDMGDFFGHYTTDLINETSMKLLGYKRAVVKNYYPIAVDRAALATQIEGLHLDATIEGRGFLKNRVKSQQPILLEECSSVVQRSLRDTAAYAGLAPAIRDVQKVLNSRIETEDGLKVLKNGILKEKWGGDAVNYVDELLTDLQTPGKKSRKSSMTAPGKLRGNYAGAILTLNPGVAIAQAASLPTAGAVLGADTMAAVVPFVKNFSDKQRAALKAEIVEHGDALLEYRLRGTQRGELESIGKNLSAAEKGLDKAPKWLTGWISGMDEITVESLWEGAKRYVERHESLTAADGDSYWSAVNRMYQKVIEETQPNYTTMQRAGIQRSDNELVKTLTMFTTQRFQNYGILADAVMDYNAQRDRYRAEPTEESRTDLKQAGEKLNRAVTSQIVQTAVFAAMKIGADFLLHRWDREQDENGDITAESLLKRYADLFMGSAAGTFLYGSEAYNLVSNVAQGKDYDVVSAPNLSAINDLGTETVRLYKLLSTDTGEMDEEELEEYHGKLRKAALTLMEDGLEMKGLPAGNAVKLMDAAGKWGGNAAYAVTGGKYGEKLSFHSLPSSATGQYDRLFNAIQNGDGEEAKAALGKLEGMGKEEKTILSQMNTRLKKYSPEVEQAAEARNEGNDRERQNITKQLIREMYETLGIRENVKEDADKRAAVIDLVTGAIDQKADALLAGDKDRTVWSDLTDALETGKRKDVQEEIDRLRTAGKEDKAIKSKITAAVKEEYLAGNDHDRARLEKMLLALTKADGEALYEEKTFAQWIKNAEKKEEAAENTADEWAEVR